MGWKVASASEDVKEAGEPAVDERSLLVPRPSLGDATATVYGDRAGETGAESDGDGER